MDTVRQTLGHYEILGPLGSGGMGDVYIARDPILGRKVAVKVLPERLATDRDSLSRFTQEARSARAFGSARPTLRRCRRFEPPAPTIPRFARKPAPTAVTCAKPGTGMGTKLHASVPTQGWGVEVAPSSPSALLPQAITVPSPSTARLWDTDAATPVTFASPLT